METTSSHKSHFKTYTDILIFIHALILLILHICWSSYINSPFSNAHATLFCFYRYACNHIEILIKYRSASYTLFNFVWSEAGAITQGEKNIAKRRIWFFRLLSEAWHIGTMWNQSIRIVCSRSILLPLPKCLTL